MPTEHKIHLVNHGGECHSISAHLGFVAIWRIRTQINIADEIHCITLSNQIRHNTATFESLSYKRRSSTKDR